MEKVSSDDRARPRCYKIIQRRVSACGPFKEIAKTGWNQRRRPDGGSCGLHASGGKTDKGKARGGRRSETQGEEVEADSLCPPHSSQEEHLKRRTNLRQRQIKEVH